MSPGPHWPALLTSEPRVVDEMTNCEPCTYHRPTKDGGSGLANTEIWKAAGPSRVSLIASPSCLGEPHVHPGARGDKGQAVEPAGDLVVLAEPSRDRGRHELLDAELAGQ